MKLSPIIVCLSALREARRTFFDQVVAHVEEARRAGGKSELSKEERKLLRSEGMAHIAEFFFLVDEGKLNKPDALKAFLERHNSDMENLLMNCKKGYTRSGLSEMRIRSAKFSEQQIELVIHESQSGRATFDQRSLGKIFAEAMSFETSRCILLLLSETDLLSRKDFRSVVLVSSTGILENLYRNHLCFIVNAMRDNDKTIKSQDNIMEVDNVS